MAPRPEKVQFVSELAAKLQGSQSAVLCDFRGMTVAEITALRNKLRAEGIQFKVIKNRLARIALKQAGQDSLDELLVGNTAWSFGVADAVAPARILTAYAKENEKLVVKGGLLEGKRIDAAGVKALASMPGRKELLARMAGDLKQPATKMASVMQAGLLKVAYAFKALADKQAA